MRLSPEACRCGAAAQLWRGGMSQPPLSLHVRSPQFRFIHLRPFAKSSFLARRLVGVLRQRVCGVRLEAGLLVLVGLLSSFRWSGALIVDVGGGGLGLLSARLVLGLGRLATGVGSRHGDLCSRQIDVTGSQMWDEAHTICGECDGWETGDLLATSIRGAARLGAAACE